MPRSDPNFIIELPLHTCSGVERDLNNLLKAAAYLKNELILAFRSSTKGHLLPVQSAATLKPTDSLSDEQEAAIEDIDSGKPVLITGAAGTGKSTLLNVLRQTYKSGLHVTASTGIAAVNVGGNTVHSCYGLGLCQDTPEKIAYGILNRGTESLENILCAEKMAIDEVSMLSAQTLDTLDKVFRIVRKNDTPFGGVQPIFFGDFLQLPPVSRDGSAKFAFEGEAWAAASVKVHQLTKVFRQEERAFAAALANARIGRVGHPSFRLIENRIGVLPDTNIRPVRLFSHNVDVDAMNDHELNTVEGQEKSYFAREWGKPYVVERLRKDCLAPTKLRLRIGAQVMLLINESPENGLVNGSIGTVTALGPNWVRVRFSNGLSWTIESHTWKIADGDQPLAQREQIPLRLAYAISCHKSQGMTLDYLECDLGRVFEYGMAYVALSRARTLDGLFIRSLNRDLVRAHPRAVQFYREHSNA